MSLTDEAEKIEMFKRPVMIKNKPGLHGEPGFCDYKKGHCTNTDACLDCSIYQSMKDVREYKGLLKGE